MKKLIKSSKKDSTQKTDATSRVNEPQASYHAFKVIPQLKDFTYAVFKKIADKSPFSQAEWANILHVSERTMQRYAKNNGSFAAINAERALQIEKVLKEAKLSFGNVENFYAWLTRNPPVPEGNLSLESLKSFDGIERVLNQLTRIQHGLFA